MACHKLPSSSIAFFSWFDEEEADSKFPAAPFFDIDPITLTLHRHSNDSKPFSTRLAFMFVHSPVPIPIPILVDAL